MSEVKHLIADSTEFVAGNDGKVPKYNHASKKFQFLPDANVVEDTGTTISFVRPTIYNSPTMPATGNITSDLTGAKKGITQKIYHNDATVPTFLAGWVNLSGIYVPNVLNIIYCCWAGGSRVEYWIIQG